MCDTVKKGLSIVRCGTRKMVFHDSCAAHVGSCHTFETPMELEVVEIEEQVVAIPGYEAMFPEKGTFESCTKSYLII